MSYKHLDAFFDQADIFYVVCDQMGNIIEVNEALCNLLQCDQERLKKDGPFPFLHPDDVESSKNIFTTLFAKKSKNERVIHRVISAKGQIKYISWVLSHFEDDNICVGVGRDFTKSSVSESLYKQTQTLGKIGSWQYDVVHDELTWSEETYNIYELSTKGQISLKRMRNFFREESLNLFDQCMDEALSKAATFDYEFDIISGKFRPAKMRMIGHCEVHDGKVYRIFGTIHDITDFRQIERKASDYQEAIDKSSIVSIADRQGTITHVNQKFCELSGYTYEELVGQDHKVLSSKYHSNSFWHNMWYKINNGEIWTGEIKNRAKDGSYFWLHTTIVPFKNAVGRIYQFVSIRYDITETKKLNEEILVSQKLSSIGEVSAQIIHEVMNPLSIISLSLDELQLQVEDVNDGSQQFVRIESLLENINVNYGRIEEIFDNMRSVLANNAVDKIAPTNLKKVLERTLTLIHTKLKSKKIKLDYSALDETHLAYSNDSDMSQIFLNMLNNSSDAVSEFQDRWIHIDSKKEDNDIVITFSDSGPGIPDDIAARIFDTLFTTKGDKRGTGLGMGICRKLIEKAGGSIILDTKAPNTTFVIRLRAST
ncbi:PAS domain S-box protein [Bacteriovorax sp. BSW11_IV]|uniref:PAS domain-containing sensor histidine kinase n=1 Tax=Bacteriovorax sp. BSW11_IV TaxID=1353529 RepID=UPI000389ED24|nr:PAS domain S-box protein [Bacteriovorax sp. BSW11_IV]EQC45186.1 PAS domain S-box protein [Bacteriovorax sp. BSW11_IV]